ncbi:MAG: 3-hydroxyacyl-CoA dehydrogenase NAD-binding domain-containing protein [Planctomycetota bacterium]
MADSNAATTVGIIGAGTMGAGIAQIAVMHGWTVELMDVSEEVAHTAIAGIGKRLDRLVEKRRMTAEDRAAAGDRLLVATSAECLAGSDLVIEAIVEDLDIKTTVLSGIIPVLRDDAIIATNTSSLSVTALGEALGEPQRTVGMHFFNPAPLMKLVEVIAGNDTSADVVERVAAIAASWNKKVARAADVPGFIVNHVARPYYLEAFRILEDRLASVDEIDDIMRRLGGFRMGPFELTDLIGQDVNTATTRSVWEQLDRPPLLTPSRMQEELVFDGHLGRKTKRGCYDYAHDPAQPAIDTHRKTLTMSSEFEAAVLDFARAAGAETTDSLEAYIFARVLSAIFVQAILACDRGVASPADIDIALQYGVNYPRGPFEWMKSIGSSYVNPVMDGLNASTFDQRFARA